MNLSVCICTRDRPGSLQRTLASLERLETPGADWEILIVDNAAADGSSQLLSRLSSSAPLRVEPEPQAGLSHARNRAVRESSADYLIFIDDDVTVPPGWLAAYVEGFERYPQAAFWGGPILARLDGSSFPLGRTKRLFEALKRVMPGVLCHLEPGLEEGPLPPETEILPWGANMAFRRSVLQARAFDPSRGRRPDDPFGLDEETQLFRELMRAGYVGVWLPGAALYHHAGPERCRRGYLKSFSRSIGAVEGRRSASRPKPEHEHSWKWAMQEREERRRARWRQAPWTPLERRLEILRDLHVIEGFIQGFQAAIEERERSSNL